VMPLLRVPWKEPRGLVRRGDATRFGGGGGERARSVDGSMSWYGAKDMVELVRLALLGELSALSAYGWGKDTGDRENVT
jgi:hypothetical protein